MSGEVIATVIGTVGGLVGTILSIWATTTAHGVRSEMQIKVLEPRLKAYKELWSLTKDASPSRKSDPTMQERERIEESLKSWYYDEGNGLFLTRLARSYVVKAKGDLLNPEVEFRSVTTTLSRLRSQLKNDIAVYGREDMTESGAAKI